jgi:hypothetical protein
MAIVKGICQSVFVTASALLTLGCVQGTDTSSARNANSKISADKPTLKEVKVGQEALDSLFADVKAADPDSKVRIGKSMSYIKVLGSTVAGCDGNNAITFAKHFTGSGEGPGSTNHYKTLSLPCLKKSSLARVRLTEYEGSVEAVYEHDGSRTYTILHFADVSGRVLVPTFSGKSVESYETIGFRRTDLEITFDGRGDLIAAKGKQIEQTTAQSSAQMRKDVFIESCDGSKIKDGFCQ